MQDQVVTPTGFARARRGVGIRRYVLAVVLLCLALAGNAAMATTVTIISPANGATQTAPASFAVQASTGSVTRVTLFANDTSIGGHASPGPYTATFATSTPGTYSLTATAFLANGQEINSAPVTVTVTAAANAPPSVALTSPSDGASAIAPASFTLNATASDSDGTVSNVAFYSGSTLVGSTSTAPYTWTYAAAPAGSYTFTAKATDNQGAVTTSAAAHVTVGAAPPVTITRQYVYDANQRLCKRIEPETGATLMDYDAAGNIAWTVTGTALTSNACDRTSVAAADKTVRGYDVNNRPFTVDVPNTTNDIAYSYLPDGALHTLTSGPSTWTYTYNHRRLPVTEQLGIDGRIETITHTYNALGQESSLTYPDGLIVATNPNALGQPSQASSYASGISYFANGGMSGFTYGNGIVHTLTQNGRELPLRSLDQQPGHAAILDDTYAYDGDADVTAITDGTSGNPNNRSMSYDGLDRLTVTNAPHQWWISATTSYDQLDNITSNTVGNRSYNYTYDTNGRLSQLTKPDHTVAMTLGYDAKGNVTSKGTGFDSYVFDAANRMTAVTNKESYVYDGYGRRVKVTRTSDSKIDYPIYSASGQLVTEDDQRSNQSIDYVSLNGSLVAKRSTTIGGSTWTTSYEHTDALHSPITETDASGVASRVERYTPYGEPSDGSYTQGPGYTGHVTDAATGLTYAQARYYDPVCGCFLSADPDPVDTDTAYNFNRYAYAGDNPYKFTDPDGREFDVIVNDNDAIIGTHAGGFRGERGPGENWIYDPWGSFGKTKDKSVRMDTGVIAGDDANLRDYIQYQYKDGPGVYLFRFATTSEEEDKIMERIEGPPGHDGDGVGERGILPSCTVDLTTVLTGIGPFKNLQVVRTPRALLKQLIELQRQGKTIGDKKKKPEPPKPPPPTPWFRKSSWGG